MKGNNDFRGKRAFVIGAGGGLGSALVRELERRGALVIAGLRDPAKAGIPTEGGSLRIDIANPASIESAAKEILSAGPVDYVAVTAGVDERKSLAAHTDAEIQRLLDVDLRGPILVTRAFLPAMLARGSGGIIHYGGFADGRLAFPYYSVDSAARAGVRSFVESVNREIAGRGPVIAFFGPAVADTAAERPFLAIWKRLGIDPVSAAAVAAEAADALSQGKELRVMGGPLTRFFAKLNGISPRLADSLLVRRYTAALEKAFGDRF